MENKWKSGEPQTVGLFDSHAHYFDARFAEQADDILQNEVFGKGVVGVVNVATSPANAKRCIAQAKQYGGMVAAVGIHPEDCMALTGDAAKEVASIRALLDTADKRRENKIVAIGEIGLDYHGETLDKARQQAFLEEQLALAQKMDLPVIIHDREAHGDCLNTVRRYPAVCGVFHSFSGSAEMAKELIGRGFYLSFSGVLTFKNARKAREVAVVVPTDRMLLETDCPYLAPEPFRGRLNHSGWMIYTAQVLAETKGMTVREVADCTRENAKRLFGIS